MSIVTLPFFLFVAATVLAYFLSPLKYRWIVLLVASYLFYWFNSAWLVLVLFGVTLVTFLIGLWIQRVSDKSAADLKAAGKELSREERKARKEAAKRTTRRILVLGIILDLATLLFLKYFNFFGENVNGLLHLLGLEGEIVPRLDLLLPLGISFYTLQAISYMTDVYRGKIRADRNPAKFMLFMSFFPQILQGPIPRHGQLAAQLYEGHRFDYKQLCFGAQQMLWGLMKKLIIAERLALPVNTLFTEYESYSGPIMFFAVFLYGLQVYVDFSGGMDIARGIAQMMGIQLEPNFAQPYYSTSIENFWRRWHMTMGHWMRDYVFYPLSLSKAFTNLSRKSRKLLGQFMGKRLPSFLAMFIVYFLVGFWHGPSWRYVIYGIWNGTFIMAGILLEDSYRKLREKLKIREESACWRWFRMGRTFVIVSFGRFFTGAGRLQVALEMFRRTFVHWKDITFLTDGTLTTLGLNTANWIVLLVGVAVLFKVDGLHERNISIREGIARQNLVFRWIIYIAAVLVVLIFGLYGPAYNASSFIYEQF